MSCKSRDEQKVARERMDATSLERYIAHLLIILGCARILPVKSFSLRQTLLFTGVTAIFFIGECLLMLSEIAAITLASNLKLIVNIVGAFGMHIQSVIKWCYCVLRNKEILDILKTLDKCHVLCQRIDNSKEALRLYKTEMEETRRYSNFFAFIWTSLAIYGVLHWCLNPLFLESWGDQINLINRTFMKRRLPFIAWYPLDTDNTNIYICIYIFQTIGGIASALGIVCYDIFYITVLMVICTQLRYINTMLTKTDFYKYDPTPKAIFNLERKLKNCVDCHVEIIKFVEMLQTFTSPTMFAQCIDAIFTLCMVSFDASAVELTLTKECLLKLWSLLEYFLVGSVQLYLFCFMATSLEQLGSQISHSVYCCGWELVASEGKRQSDFAKQLKPCNVEKLVQTIMVRAQKPIILTGGPFYELSLETFRVIMSMAMSNCVMLRTISERDE